MNETSDEDLIRAALKGDQKSYADLVHRHQPPILRMAQRHLRQREEAEDVVQQVFVQAYRHLSSFRGESKFFTWLYTIALNLIRNQVRQRNLKRMVSLDSGGPTDDAPSPQWPDRSPSTEDVVHHRRELERVVEALKHLGEPHRAIFTLHYFQYLSLKDVAVRVGRPVGTVKVYLHRARIAILERMKRPAAPGKDKPGAL
jgi:RNA polymerase sigma-70 factor (ECF subfamily)